MKDQVLSIRIKNGTKMCLMDFASEQGITLTELMEFALKDYITKKNKDCNEKILALAVFSGKFESMKDVRDVTR